MNHERGPQPFSINILNYLECLFGGLVLDVASSLASLGLNDVPLSVLTW